MELPGDRAGSGGDIESHVAAPWGDRVDHVRPPATVLAHAEDPGPPLVSGGEGGEQGPRDAGGSGGHLWDGTDRRGEAVMQPRWYPDGDPGPTTGRPVAPNFGYMNEIEMHPRTGRADPAREPSPTLTMLLWIVAAAILTQAMLAGLFISATAPALLAHTIIGSFLPWFAIAPAVLAFRRRRSLDQRVVTGSILLPVGLWIQETLGHMPFAVSTAIHVPLGVALFAASVVLALASGRVRNRV